ncbi:MAG: DNA repair protein RecO [Crocinitomicaceae bacterium]|nr:DNA repair protein RecO [Crocinitomicaceae bacterium]
MKYTDQGVFLHRTPYSDSSLVVTYYTRENGLQKFLFRGGKKKAHSVFPMAVSELSFYGRPESELFNLTTVESEFSQSFQFDPIKSSIAFFMAETLRKCVHEGDADLDVFEFIVDYIKELEATSDLMLFPVSFLIGFSEVLGFKPLLESTNAHVFNLDAGTFQLVGSASERTRRGFGVDIIASLLFSGTLPLNTTKVAREDALEIMLDYFMIHVPHFKALDSYEIVKEVLHA